MSEGRGLKVEKMFGIFIFGAGVVNAEGSMMMVLAVVFLLFLAALHILWIG